MMIWIQFQWHVTHESIKIQHYNSWKKKTLLFSNNIPLQIQQQFLSILTLIASSLKSHLPTLFWWQPSFLLTQIPVFTSLPFFPCCATLPSLPLSKPALLPSLLSPMVSLSMLYLSSSLSIPTPSLLLHWLVFTWRLAFLLKHAKCLMECMRETRSQRKGKILPQCILQDKPDMALVMLSSSLK